MSFQYYDSSINYGGNKNLKRSGVKIDFTQEQVDEINRCAGDCVYFLENYMKIITLDHGLVTFKPRKYQKDIVQIIDQNRFTILKLPRQCGKCVLINTPIVVRNSITGVIYELTFGEFWQLVSAEQEGNPKEECQEVSGGLYGSKNLRRVHDLWSQGNPAKEDPVLPDRKYVDIIDLSGWEVETDFGFQPAARLMKTVPYEVYEVLTSSGVISCADDHLFMKDGGEWSRARDLFEGDLLVGRSGPEKVLSVRSLGREEEMYDLEVDHPNHRFWTGHLLSHNSTIVVSYLLWKVLFTADQNIGIIANRGKLAAELLGKLRLAYEYIPFWMQQGITEWNKGNIALENNSKIQATAAVRGESYNCVDRDTLVTVRRGDLVRHLTISDLYELTRQRIPLDKYKERKEGRRPLFIDNKYKRAYDRLMERARNRGRVDGYTEEHHVVPRSIDPASTDTVTLTAREHYVAHRLLVKFTSGTNKSKMVMALHTMSTCSKEKRRLSIPSRTYQRIREEEARRGMRDPIKTKKTAETRRGMKRPIESRKKMRGKSPWNDGLVFPDFRRRHFHNPETGQRLFMDPALGIPDGFVPGRGSLPRAR